MRVLLTRPRSESEPLTAALLARGIESAIDPMLEIVLKPAPVQLAGVQAVLLTSANGARALAQSTWRRDLLVLTVGGATAAAARAAGFADVDSADGDVNALCDLASNFDPRAGIMLHVCGAAVAGDLSGMLTARGFTVRRAVLYEAKEATALSEDTITAVREGKLDGALFFSPRTASTFVTLAEAAGVALSSLTAWCLSAAIAEAASSSWRAVKVAPRPDQRSLVELVANGPA